MLTIRLSTAIEARLNALAKHTGRTISFHVRKALREHLGNLEDIYLAEKRLIKLRAGHAKKFQKLGRGP